MSKYRIFLAGDSTVESYTDGGAICGWGQPLLNYFTDEVTIINKAKAGRSTKSFIDEGRFDEIKDMLGAGDFLLIQFGHNDQKLEDPARGTKPFGEYQDNLRMFITAARDRGAIPILLTPVSRRRFDANNRIEQSFGEYPAAMQQVAEQMNVALIDLRAKSAAYYEYIGPEASTRLFAWYGLENPQVKEPDNTHFSAYGAEKIAELVIECMQALKLPFIECLK